MHCAVVNATNLPKQHLSLLLKERNMSGVFPDSGVPPSDANNSLPDPNTINCPSELWHSTSRCTPRFDPSSANAIISEVINLVQCAGLPYDCSKLDNLCTA